MDADARSSRSTQRHLAWIPLLILLLAAVNVPVVVDAIVGGRTALGWSSAAVWSAAALAAAATLILRWRHPPTRQSDVEPAAIHRAVHITRTKSAAAQRLRADYPRLGRFDARMLVGLTADSPGRAPDRAPGRAPGRAAGGAPDRAADGESVHASDGTAV